MSVNVFIDYFYLKVYTLMNLANELILNLNIYNLNFLIFIIQRILIIFYLVVQVLSYSLRIIFNDL